MRCGREEYGYCNFTLRYILTFDGLVAGREIDVPLVISTPRIESILSWVLGDVSLFLSELTFGVAPESFGNLRL